MDFLLSPTSAQTSTLQWQSGAQTSQLSGLQAQATSNDDKKLKQAAKDFESVFVNQMLEAMDKTVDRDNSIMSGGSGEQYFRSMLNEEIAKSMTNRTGGSGFGLAEAIYKQMSKNLPVAAPATGSTPSAQTGNAASGINHSQGSGKSGEVKS